MKIGDVYVKDGYIRIVGFVTDADEHSQYFHGDELWWSKFTNKVCEVNLGRTYRKDDPELQCMPVKASLGDSGVVVVPDRVPSLAGVRDALDAVDRHEHASRFDERVCEALAEDQ